MQSESFLCTGIQTEESARFIDQQNLSRVGRTLRKLTIAIMHIRCAAGSNVKETDFFFNLKLLINVLVSSFI